MCLKLNNLKLHEAKAMKNICIQEKIVLGLTFDPGLELIGVRTTWP